jgi:hypothetical protein
MYLIFLDVFADVKQEQRACKLASQLYSKGRTVMFISYRTDIMLALYGQLIRSNAGHCLFHDQHRFSVNSNLNYVFGSQFWSVHDLKPFHGVWNSTKASTVIWITSSWLSNYEQALSNYVQWVLEGFGSYVTVYNLREEPTIQTNIQIDTSAVTEILVRNWEIVNLIGPWLFKNECTSKY